MSSKMHTKATSEPAFTSVLSSPLHPRHPLSSRSLLFPQRRPLSNHEPLTNPPIVHEALISPGKPPDSGPHTLFNPRLGHDFGKVRVYADEKAVQLWPIAMQAKLMINQPGDIYEQEAERVARQLFSSVPLQRKCKASCFLEDEKKKVVQRKNNEVSTSASVSSDLIRNLGPGQPLNPVVRAFFEPRFGHDFSKVRIHADARAAEAARAVNSRAFTAGKDVVFGKGEYAPSTVVGQRLLAHELTHVVQQHPWSYGILMPFNLHPQIDTAEREATKNANLVVSGGPFQVIRQVRPDVVMHQPENKEAESPGVLDTIIGGLVGEFKEDPTYAMVGVDMGVSLVPILDQVSDVRDISAHIYYMTAHEQYKNPGRWVGLVFTLIGLVPEIGTIIKSISKYIIKGVGEFLSRLEEILKLVREVLPEITDIGRLQKYIAENWDNIVTMGKKNWDSALDRASYWAELISKFGSERVQQIKEALAMIKEIAPKKLDEAFGWVRRQLDDILEKVRERLRLEASPPAKSVTAATETAKPPSRVWEKYGTVRGETIENYIAKLFGRMGDIRRLPKNFKGIDFVAGGTTKVIKDQQGKWMGEVIEDAIGISEKSIDLGGKSLQTSEGIYGALGKYFNQLHDFTSYKLKGIEVRNLKEKILNIRYGPGELSAEQAAGMARFIELCNLNNIKVNISLF